LWGLRHWTALDARLVVLKYEVRLGYKWEVVELVIENLVEGITLTIDIVEL
jgi:hypothetical protein